MKSELKKQINYENLKLSKKRGWGIADICGGCKFYTVIAGKGAYCTKHETRITYTGRCNQNEPR